MSDDITKQLSDPKSFEERVFARLDALADLFNQTAFQLNQRLDHVDQRLDRVDERLDRMDGRLDRMDQRFDAVDARLNDIEQRLEKLEQKAYDTKPIWERALAEILALGVKLDSIERKVNVLGLDMLSLRADQTRLEDRLDRLESKPA